MGLWDDVKKGAGYAVEGATLGAYNPYTGGGYGKSLPIVGGILSGPQTADTSPSQGAVNSATKLQKYFATQGQTSPFNQGQQAGVLGQQQANVGVQGQNIAGLQNIASGLAPSAAQIQLQQQGAANAANQFGAAAALQGRDPGAALRMATTGAVNTQAATNAQAAQQRAADMATAQGQLTGAIGNQANTLGSMQNQSIGAAQNYAGNQLGALGQGVNASTGLQNANNANAASNNAYYGGILSGAAGIAAKAAGAPSSPAASAASVTPAGGYSSANPNGLVPVSFNTQAQGGAQIKSDRTSKTDVQHADPDKLADALQAFVFKYKPGEGPGGQRVGIMAQDALKGGPMGRGMVDRGGDGKLQLDGSNAVGAALAMASEALKRTKRKAA